ncbi:YycH protein [Lactobacillus taiwanensis DSM 21401]|uniref:two-component system regulatory protein YycI n=1 Tax=Lactobacillus taiwanensis TaxID=508451 RepID=UPI0006EF6762|nr:two-component system regulatory protein YycI [Lactobacillus taiwanensis]KRN00376.1 YycH protein [Lactobacillus taiwanensis DSM 21401]
MDFKRIEWIFLVVFIGINIFLVIELWQTPTLLSAHSTPTQTDIKSETSADQITIPKVNDKQGDGYYLAAKVDNSWSKKAAAQINEQVETNASDNSISVNLNKPVTISKKQKEALKEVIRFKNNSQNVYQGKDYVYIPELSEEDDYVFSQNTKYGEVFSNTARLHIIVKNNQIVSYSQRYVNDLNPVRERQNTISSKAAVNSLYTYSELPNNSKIIWLKQVYTRLITVRGSSIYIPTWVAAIENNNSKTVTLKRVNAFTGTIIQNNITDDDAKG